MLTIDASVWVSAAIPGETDHSSSEVFLNRVINSNTRIIVPSLVLPEVSGALSRRLNNASDAIQYASAIEHFNNLTLVNCDAIIARLAMQIAAMNSLRGADAVYAAIAARFNCTLITLDREQINRLTPLARVLMPSSYS